MLLRIANSPRHYEWGSLTGASQVLGTTPSGLPEAEVWFGTHHASPTQLVDRDGGHETLAQFLAEEHVDTGFVAGRIPFLLKVLSAGQPLSLQVHPSPEQARAGFARENAAGIPLDAPHRNYKDDQAKPELIVAVSDEFVGLSGFRRVNESVDALRALLARTPSAAEANRFADELASRAESDAPASLRWAFEFLLGDHAEVADIVATCTAGARDFLSGGSATSRASSSALHDVCQTMSDLAEFYPGDPGIVLGALLNRVVLARGEALYLPAGNVHAYLRGTGIELMNASDNVLRGGLTSKHVDVTELLAVADFSELAQPRLEMTEVVTGLSVFAPASSALRLFAMNLTATHVEATGGVQLELDAPAIVLCTGGEVSVLAEGQELDIRHGDAVFVRSADGVVGLRGSGEAFLATVSEDHLSRG